MRSLPTKRHTLMRNTLKWACLCASGQICLPERTCWVSLLWNNCFLSCGSGFVTDVGVLIVADKKSASVPVKLCGSSPLGRVQLRGWDDRWGITDGDITAGGCSLKQVRSDSRHCRLGPTMTGPSEHPDSSETRFKLQSNSTRWSRNQL